MNCVQSYYRNEGMISFWKISFWTWWCNLCMMCNCLWRFAGTLPEGQPNHPVHFVRVVSSSKGPSFGEWHLKPVKKTGLPSFCFSSAFVSDFFFQFWSHRISGCCKTGIGYSLLGSGLLISSYLAHLLSRCLKERNWWIGNQSWRKRERWDVGIAINA